MFTSSRDSLHTHAACDKLVDSARMPNSIEYTMTHNIYYIFRLCTDIFTFTVVLFSIQLLVILSTLRSNSGSRRTWLLVAVRLRSRRDFRVILRLILHLLLLLHYTSSSLCIPARTTIQRERGRRRRKHHISSHLLIGLLFRRHVCPEKGFTRLRNFWS